MPVGMEEGEMPVGMERWKEGGGERMKRSRERERKVKSVIVDIHLLCKFFK